MISGARDSEFKEIIVRRRSVRKFKKDTIPEQILNSILEAGRWAPSASNSQPWHFIVVTSTETKSKIAQLSTKFSKEHWRRFSPQQAKYIAARGGSWDKSYMVEIPILLVVCCKLSESMRDELALGSVWMAVENILLAATDEGLGSCVYTFLNRKEENELKSILRVNMADRIACIIQLGYTKTVPEAPSRKQLNTIVSYEHF